MANTVILLYFNLATSTTVHTIGLKKANIRTHRQENWVLTVIKAILESREKLASLLIFKAKEGKDA